MHNILEQSILEVVDPVMKAKDKQIWKLGEGSGTQKEDDEIITTGIGYVIQLSTTITPTVSIPSIIQQFTPIPNPILPTAAPHFFWLWDT